MWVGVCMCVYVCVCACETLLAFSFHHGSFGYPTHVFMGQGGRGASLVSRSNDDPLCVLSSPF